MAKEPKKFDPTWLKGLIYRSAEEKKVKEDGREKRKYFPTERPLTEADVLDFKDLGDKVTIVTADGQKYTIKK